METRHDRNGKLGSRSSSGNYYRVGRLNVDCDLNHPFAGKTLTFDVEVVSVREATSEEVSHGHVHAAGGCGHSH